MKIVHTDLHGFMLFEDLDVSWSDNINIISGENSTGKTTVLKALYSATKPLTAPDFLKLTKEQQEQRFVNKMLGVFRPDEMHLGRLTRRKQGMNATCCNISFDGNRSVDLSFNSKKTNHADLQVQGMQGEKFDAVFLPTKEMISSTEHFASLYEDYHIDFEETYYDLVKLLDRPLSKGPNTSDQRRVISSLQDIILGNVVQKDRKFYLEESGAGIFEMGLVSEGYRKIAILLYLVLTGSLGANTILFWDEPETNMNPKMMRPLVSAMVELARSGVQIFVTTHDYFLIQEFNLYNVYPQLLNLGSESLDIRFYSLYAEEGRGISVETGRDVTEMEHNSIMQQFDEMYKREQDLMYGTK